mmetsp:Transcript_55463/g.98801  ORF Transcript_55463/g.98801 Transcript_55463/m.98801 type:complete len:241 (-) Transcript_55463:756-1478(-)
MHGPVKSDVPRLSGCVHAEWRGTVSVVHGGRGQPSGRHLQQPLAQLDSPRLELGLHGGLRRDGSDAVVDFAEPLVRGGGREADQFPPPRFVLLHLLGLPRQVAERGDKVTELRLALAVPFLAGLALQQRLLLVQIATLDPVPFFEVLGKRDLLPRLLVQELRLGAKVKPHPIHDGRLHWSGVRGQDDLVLKHHIDVGLIPVADLAHVVPHGVRSHVLVHQVCVEHRPALRHVHSAVKAGH